MSDNVALAEHYDQVSCNDLRLAVNQYAFSCTYNTADVGFLRQVYVLDLVTGDRTAFFGVELHDLGVRARQVMYASYRRVQQHLVDITGGDGLFVQHRAYIQPFRHGDVVEVLYFCDGLAYTETLCGKAGKDVRFAAVGYGYEYVVSTMDRIKAAALAQSDTTLQMPIITPVASETWSVKESLAEEADAPEWGSREERGISMEIQTAAADLVSGSNAVILRHPQSVATIAKMIKELA